MQPELLSSPTPERDSLLNLSFTATIPTAPRHKTDNCSTAHQGKGKEDSRFREYVESWDLLRASGPRPNPCPRVDRPRKPKNSGPTPLESDRFWPRLA